MSQIVIWCITIIFAEASSELQVWKWKRTKMSQKENILICNINHRVPEISSCETCIQSYVYR